jgi:hypothetical protein
MTDRCKVRAYLMAQRLADARLDERPLRGALDDSIAGPRGAWLVAHDVTGVHACVDAPLVLGVIGERQVDGALVG